MQITLFGYFVVEAIKEYLFKRYGLDDEKMFIESIDIKPDLPNQDKILQFPERFERDQYYDHELEDFVTTTEYDVEGIYLKRKKKGSKKYHYVKLEHRDFYRPELNEDESSLDIWIEHVPD
tara:strand:+ start:3263 stop:3625 length:363 start_codon:yes stop_codon:yes gene_type:complete